MNREHDEQMPEAKPLVYTAKDAVLDLGLQPDVNPPKLRRPQSKTTPTVRTRRWLEKLGYLVGNVETWNSFARIRQDLFGCIDLVAISPKGVVHFIQVTSATNRAARRTKMRDKGAELLSRLDSNENSVLLVTWNGDKRTTELIAGLGVPEGEIVWRHIDL